MRFYEEEKTVDESHLSNSFMEISVDEQKERFGYESSNRRHYCRKHDHCKVYTNILHTTFWHVNWSQPFIFIVVGPTSCVCESRRVWSFHAHGRVPADRLRPRSKVPIYHPQYVLRVIKYILVNCWWNTFSNTSLER